MHYKNILLIDDDVEDQEIFTDALIEVSRDVQYTSFTNAKNALSKLVNNEVHPDVIFLDLNMPIMSGEEFLIAIKNIDALKVIPVIIFSTTSNEFTKAKTKGLGAAHFITKPDRFNELVDILNRLFITI